ncbi:hypothetical protein U9M48_003041 [Paspalum notatum var. saurae]|uniref:Integrase catalytic domain-containing protein n=1 Tax=Paspalum notatum var. saurae TaxID=547442 RepID=A0AAQ3PI13_PASNO
MTGHRKWFFSLKTVNTKEYITFWDNDQVKVLGVGSVLLSAKLSLRGVAFVRNLGFNLVSVSQLLNEGFEGRPHICFWPCSLFGSSADIWKWHRRLGHLSFDLLVRLSSMGLIRGLPKLRAKKDVVCHPCRHGKMVAASHIPVSQVMTSYPDELLHLDTIGPARVASVSGKWYVLVVVDDFSRFSWVFFMEFKDEAFGFVRDLVLRLRNESHKAIRAIRSDNGGEFRNSHFKNFCRDLDLEHQFSSPYTPPQNGVVEHKNRTLVEMAQTMLDEHRTPRRFWAEVVNTACYIANRIFLRAFLGKTSFELRFGRQPSVKHLRAFGCRCFVLKKAGHLDEFESRCLDGIFLGYASSSRAFRVWILEAKQVVETCEVSFDETMPCTTPAFELSGDDEEGTPIFEDEEGAVNDVDAGATALTAAPAPSTTTSDDDGGPLPTASSSLPLRQAHAEVGPAFFSHSAYVASFEPWDVSHALSDPNWVNAMHEELENFERNHVWDLVEPPSNCRPIGTMGVFKNKQARLEAIRILLAFAASKGFKSQQMDVKSAFLNGFIDEKVYVRQPPSFESAKILDRVYKLRKALYGLKQAPRAWYARLKSFLLKSGFVMGLVDKTLFLFNHGGDTLIVQIYVDDIIFGGSSHALVSSFAEQMSREFEMSLMGGLQFFLGLQIKQGLEGSSLSFRGFSDTDHAGCRIDRKSTSGTCQLLGTFLASWSSHKQASVALSTTEAEYVAATSCCSQLLWMKATLSDFGLRLQVEGVDNALIKGEIESQWTGLIALLV